MARRLALTALAVVALLGGAAAAGLHYAAATLEDKLREALGPESQVEATHLGWSAVEVRGVRMPAPQGWPTADALRAARITVTPDLGTLLSSRQVRISRIVVEEAYLSVFRTRDGRLRLLPGMLEKKAAEDASSAGPGLPVSIAAIELHDSALELFDASIAQPAHRLRLERLEARLTDLRLPALDARSTLSLEGAIPGVQRSGSFSVKGDLQLATRDSEISTRLRGVDLVALQPYLIKASETGVKRGSLDLDLQSTVRQKRLQAPGSLTVSQLELASSPGALGTFMGMPRSAVVGLLKDRDDRISVKFLLEGRLDDPRFSVNEAFMKRVGTSMAESLGVSLESVARGVSSTTQSLGKSLGKLFGK